VATKGKHTRSTPQLTLATPEADPEKIIRKIKTSQEGTSIVVSGDFGILNNPSLKTPVVSSNSPITPFFGVSRILNFGSFPIDLSPPSIGLEGESVDTPISPKVVQCFRPRTS
jgi:hypothetical protein